MELSVIIRNLEGRLVPHNPVGIASSPILDQIKNIWPSKIPIVRNLEVNNCSPNPGRGQGFKPYFKSNQKHLDLQKYGVISYC